MPQKSAICDHFDLSKNPQFATFFDPEKIRNLRHSETLPLPLKNPQFAGKISRVDCVYITPFHPPKPLICRAFVSKSAHLQGSQGSVWTNLSQKSRKLRHSPIPATSRFLARLHTQFSLENHKSLLKANIRSRSLTPKKCQFAGLFADLTLFDCGFGDRRSRRHSSEASHTEAQAPPRAFTCPRCERYLRMPGVGLPSKQTPLRRPLAEPGRRLPKA